MEANGIYSSLFFEPANILVLSQAHCRPRLFKANRYWRERTLSWELVFSTVNNQWNPAIALKKKWLDQRKDYITSCRSRKWSGSSRVSDPPPSLGLKPQDSPIQRVEYTTPIRSANG